MDLARFCELDGGPAPSFLRLPRVAVCAAGDLLQNVFREHTAAAKFDSLLNQFKQHVLAFLTNCRKCLISITSLRPKRSVFTFSHALLSSATQGPTSLPSTINRRSVWPSMIEIFNMGPFRNVGTQARSLPNLPHSKCTDCNAGFHHLVSRVEIVESVSDFCVPLGIGSIQEAGARAIKPGPER